VDKLDNTKNFDDGEMIEEDEHKLEEVQGLNDLQVTTEEHVNQLKELDNSNDLNQTQDHVDEINLLDPISTNINVVHKRKIDDNEDGESYESELLSKEKVNITRNKKSKSNDTSYNKKHVGLVQENYQEKVLFREKAYDDLTYVITYPLMNNTIEIEKKTKDILGVHFKDIMFTDNEILDFQLTWSHKSTPVVKLTISDINRICNVTQDGQFSANLIKFWILWISRLSDKDNSDFFICQPDLYSKLMEDGFKFERVSNKVTCDIFEKKIIVMPIALGKKIWSVCVILNPISLVKPIKFVTKSKSLAPYAVQLFDVSSRREHELKSSSLSNSICNNVTLWVKHLWYKIKKQKLPINDDKFRAIRKNIPFSCKY
jgi:hypothetical protein